MSDKTENEDALMNDEIELKKLRRIASCADVIARDYWKYLNEDDAKYELKCAVNDYNGWMAYAEKT